MQSCIIVSSVEEVCVLCLSCRRGLYMCICPNNFAILFTFLIVHTSMMCLGESFCVCACLWVLFLCEEFVYLATSVSSLVTLLFVSDDNYSSLHVRNSAHLKNGVRLPYFLCKSSWFLCSCMNVVFFVLSICVLIILL